DPQPVVRCADKEEVVPGAEDTADQGHSDDQVQPFLDDFTVYAGSANQNERQDGTQDQFPYTFNPQVHDPPPEVLVHHQRGGVIEGEHPECCQTDQTGCQHHADHGLATLEHGHDDVKEKA